MIEKQIQIIFEISIKCSTLRNDEKGNDSVTMNRNLLRVGRWSERTPERKQMEKWWARCLRHRDSLDDFAASVKQELHKEYRKDSEKASTALSLHNLFIL